ncbi:hypothetical protein LGL08_20520 [Clostridium estertheticum]|uniref:hypothetical protein n=1 Tax=Clostridium estertheticum TaxID=238834 RepID=UPI001CF47933|nr:hypothetical protein [Clostridium estertheticum]MCB2308832.1 hypothetical protein [Clostridium estertheticum]MCB2347320.1 hypothetical protein [Clostridium estertheticum]MCB2351914.1 hypothetical protein [Clostridium estertheticum]WAG48519.1 hypothetical protein LL127_23280 [Clostridium estertheticum]
MEYKIDMKDGYGFRFETEEKDFLNTMLDKVKKGNKIIMICDELMINVDELASIVRI